MDENELLGRVIDLVEEFERHDSDLLSELTGPGDLDDLAEALGRTTAAKMAVKKLLAARPALKTTDALREKLRKIRDNYGYNIDRICDAFSSMSGDQVSQEAEDIDYVQALFERGTRPGGGKDDGHTPFLT